VKQFCNYLWLREVIIHIEETVKTKMSDNEDDHDVDDAISEVGHEPARDDDEEVSSIHSTTSKGRGRPRVIESWTRVISLEHDDLDAQYVFPLNTDLIMSQNLPRDILRGQEHGWQPFFFPKDFVKEHLGITTDNFTLDDECLLESGKQVSQLRKSCRERAEESIIGFRGDVELS
jgi:hypothetical protein